MSGFAGKPAGNPRVERSFRRSLHSYHQSALVQKRIARELVAQLTKATDRRHFERAFEFGCGTGLLTQELLQHLTIDRLHLNDLVPESRGRSLALAGQYDTDACFDHGPVETCPLPSPLDLVASASVVQWIDDHAALLARLNRALESGGWLALSGFARDHFAELRALGSDAAAPGYRDPDEWAALLPDDMELVTLRHSHHILRFDSTVQLLRHLRQTGVNAHARQPWSRRRLAAFEADYHARFGIDGKLPLTYSPVWIIARKR